VLLSVVAISGALIGVSHLLSSDAGRPAEPPSPTAVSDGPGTAVAAGPIPAGWSRYVAPDGSFSIVAPGYAREEVTNDRGIPVTRVWFPPAPSGTYGLYRIAYPSSRWGTDASLLEFHVRSTIRRFGGTVLGQDEISSGGHPGVRLWIEKGRWLFGADLYVLDRQFFRLDVRLEKDPPEQWRHLAETFLGSFRPSSEAPSV
jgi:hypothetical protein